MIKARFIKKTKQISMSIISIVLCLTILFSVGYVEPLNVNAIAGVDDIFWIILIMGMVALGITFSTVEEAKEAAGQVLSKLSNDTIEMIKEKADYLSKAGFTVWYQWTGMLVSIMSWTKEAFSDLTAVVVDLFGMYILGGNLVSNVVFNSINSYNLMTEFTFNSVTKNSIVSMNFGAGLITFFGSAAPKDLLKKHTQKSNFSGPYILVDYINTGFASMNGWLASGLFVNGSHVINYDFLGIEHHYPLRIPEIISGYSSGVGFADITMLPSCFLSYSITLGVFNGVYALSFVNGPGAGLACDVAIGRGLVSMPNGINDLPIKTRWQTEQDYTNWMLQYLYGRTIPDVNVDSFPGVDTWPGDISIGDIDVWPDTLSWPDSIDITIPKDITDVIDIPIDIARDIPKDLPKETDDTNPDTGNPPGTDTKPGTLPNLSIPEIIFKEKFPFCLPWDVYNLFTGLSAKGEAPSFTIPFKFERLGINYSFKLDMTQFNEIAGIIRFFLSAMFVIALIMLSRKLTGSE